MKLPTEDSNKDYVKLESSNNDGEEEVGDVELRSPINGRSWWWWAKVIALCIFLVLLVIVVIKWAGPFFMNKEVIPIINWEMSTFSSPVLAVVIFASVALFPVVFIPSTPSMWVAGMTFGYGIGFLLIIAGVAVGVSLPYFIGSLFLHKVQRWLEKHPKEASIIRLAGEGNWFHQFRAITLIRISPFPYTIFNYAVVAMNVKYSPYLVGSLVGMVPEIFVAIYSGILIRTLADATQEQKPVSTLQLIFDIVGFCVTVGSAVIIGIYASRRLKKLQEEEELLLE